MQQHFDFLKVSRNNVLRFLSQFDEEQMNTIPEGFNNNLAWNLGHLVATQQLLNYKLSGLPFHVNDELIDKYRKGTKPTAPIKASEIGLLNELMTDCVDKLVVDYNEGVFKEFKTYTTSFNATLTSIENAIAFNNIHEGLHLGYIMAMGKLV